MLLTRYFRISLKRFGEIKTDLFFSLLYHSFYIISVATVWFIFSSSFDVFGLSWEELTLLSIYANLSIASIAFFGYFGVRDLINNPEKLDFYLKLPKNPIYHIYVSKINPFELVNILVNVLGIFVLSFYFNLKIGFLGIVLLLFSFILLYLLLNLAFLSFFWIGKGAEKLLMYLRLFVHYSKYPLRKMGFLAKFIFMTLIPIYFIANFPVEAMHDFKVEIFLLELVVVIFLFFMNIYLWKKGIKKYESWGG